MIGFQNQVSLKSLTPRSSLVALLRTLYRIGLDYCVLPPTGEYACVIVLTKDQLVSLIERSNSEMYIAEIPKRVTQGLFKPFAIFKPDSPLDDFVPNGDFDEPERLQVLVVEEDGAKIFSLKEALGPRVPNFPEWWEAPVPFAMCGYGKLHINNTAMLMFGPDLERMPIGNLPEKNEFLVTLEGGESHFSVAFRRLEGDIFILEDSTNDIGAAEEVAWWAAVGKAWTATLDLEKRAYWRCDEKEAERFRSGKNIVLSCEWGGELLGYFCVGNEADTKDTHFHPRPNQTGEADKAPRFRSKRSRNRKKSAFKKLGEKIESVESVNIESIGRAEDDVLNALGPQTLGLLASGVTFLTENNAEDEM